jgi:hypothetical protein
MVPCLFVENTLVDRHFVDRFLTDVIFYRHSHEPIVKSNSVDQMFVGQIVFDHVT